jgi:cytochrome c biogenesis protein CcdA
MPACLVHLRLKCSYTFIARSEPGSVPVVASWITLIIAKKAKIKVHTCVIAWLRQLSSSTSRRHMTFRVLVAFFAGVTSAITTVLIPVAYFGDKNSRWAKRLAIIAFIAAVILMVATFWGV